MKQKIKKRKIEKKKRREVNRLKQRKEEAAFARLQKAARPKGSTIRKSSVIIKEASSPL